MDKNEIDYHLISLSKQKEDYDSLLYYYREINDGIKKLKHDVEEKIIHLTKLYLSF